MSLRDSIPAPLAIAVLIPCYNEEKTVAAVVRDFRAVLPEASVYVYDNNSVDNSCREALSAGAEVRCETVQGKGWVVRRMFADIDADYYVLVDGDDTYDASMAPRMVTAAQEQRLAMLVGRRIHEAAGAYRPGHVIGNKLFTSAVAWIFGRSFTDILSGYRVFSRAFVKSFPVFSGGFEIETELTIHALTLALPVSEMASTYRERPSGSNSKLNTYRDGARILLTIISLFKNEKPLAFFSALGVLCLGVALILAYPLFVTFLKTGLVPRFPTAILATGLGIYALIMFACGLILDTVTKGRREMRLLAYLNASRQGGRPVKS
jgi:glycosyltransferase involved in cell wall biosynthesis